MIKEILALMEKYKDMSRRSEYVSIGQVTNDLYQLSMEARLKRIPKRLR